jgi:hypothetical protein
MLLLPTNVIINILDNLDHEGLMKVYNLGDYYVTEKIEKVI